MSASRRVAGSSAWMLAALACLLGGGLLRSAPLCAQETPPELVDAPGRDVVVTVCSDCHDAAPKIVKLRKSRSEWAELITDMQNRGLVAGEQDLEIVLNYLASHYGPPSENGEPK